MAATPRPIGPGPIRLGIDALLAGYRAVKNEIRAARFARRADVAQRLAEVQHKRENGESPKIDPPDLLEHRLKKLGA